MEINPKAESVLLSGRRATNIGLHVENMQANVCKTPTHYTRSKTTLTIYAT